MTTTTVGALSAATLTFRAMRSQLVSWGRFLALAALAATPLVFAVIIRVADNPTTASASETAVEYVLTLGLFIIVPLVPLFMASASLGASHHEGSLVYLWLRPMGRLPMAVGGWAAATSLALPFNLVSTVGSVLILEGSAEVTVSVAAATALATFAYAAVFGLLSLLVQHAIGWGIAYVLVWEAVVASFGRFTARLSIRGYASTIAASPIDTEVVPFPPSSTGALVALVVATVVGILGSAWRLQSADIQ